MGGPKFKSQCRQKKKPKKIFTYKKIIDFIDCLGSFLVKERVFFCFPSFFLCFLVVIVYIVVLWHIIFWHLSAYFLFTDQISISTKKKCICYILLCIINF